MKKIQALAGILLMILLACPMTSSAKFPGLLRRYQVGYSFVMNTATYEAKNKINVMNIDTGFTAHMNTSAAFGVTMGTSIPIKRLGRTSKLVLGIDYLYNAMTWQSKVPSLGTSGEMDFSGVTVQMALPIGLDFKFGADALNVRNRRFCATAGFGIYPSYSLTALDVDLEIDPGINVAPYAKVEIGIFAGICMKVRAIYAIGNFTYMDYEKKVDEGGVSSSSIATVTGKSNLTLSLVLMPFSFLWEEEDWWNTY